MRGLLRIESLRRAGALIEAMRVARRLGRSKSHCIVRTAISTRLVRVLDGAIPGGANCLRYSLWRMATDRAAADATLFIGLNREGAGHAWLSIDADAGCYEATFAFPFDETSVR